MELLPRPPTPCLELHGPWRAAPRRSPRERPWRRRLALLLLRASWCREDLGREAWEIEAWPCSRAKRKRSGHPRVSSCELRQVALNQGRGYGNGVLDSRHRGLQGLKAMDSSHF